METQSTSYKLRLGIFVTSGFILFVLAIFLIGRQKNLFDPVFRLTTTFYNVSGLQVGNNVRFSGINVGTVEKIIQINDSAVQVHMIVKKSVQPFIKNDGLAAIGSEGIVGDRVLIITQGSTEAESIKNQEQLLSIEPVETDAIITSLAITAVNFEMISGQLAEIMININQGNGTLGRLILDSTIAENINKTIINLRKSSRGLDENMTAAKSNFLLKGYFNRKEKQAEKDKQDSVKISKEAAKTSR